MRRRSNPAGAWMLSTRAGFSVRLEKPVVVAGRDEHERAGRRGHLGLADEEGQLALEHVEAVVLLRVHVRVRARARPGAW